MIQNKKMNVLRPVEKPGGLAAPIPRIYRRKTRGKKGSRILIKCGDCDKSLEIYPDPNEGDGVVEIGGVLAHKDD